MRIGVVTLVPTAVAAVDDSSTLLTIATQSSMAESLLSAVGHRNVTNMQVLIQELAEESLTGVGQFDESVKEAITKIKQVFVKSIQSALQDQHKADQEHFNCFTKDCFGGCMTTYEDNLANCAAQRHHCDTVKHNAHVTCRVETKRKYITMAKKCGDLHCFEIKPLHCPEPSCKCGDVSNCHRKGLGDYATCESKADAGDCNVVEYGTWLNQTISHYEGIHAEWSTLREECAGAYKDFLTIDTSCDATQEQFEACQCESNYCEDQACGVTYEACEAGCWADYTDLVKSKECLEKDRKIDWSATKKIECYIDVLLHDYTKEELVEKCGSETCINTAREEEYKACEQVCPNIDHDGHWPEVDQSSLASASGVKILGHSKRSAIDSFLLGDGSYACDNNGDNVFTKHRGSTHREGEARCTEHLDIDYQTPQCMACKEPPPPVCDAAFHKKWYWQFDDAATFVYNECQINCPWGPYYQETSTNGETLHTITVQQHSEAWAFNRCECQECTSVLPAYPGRPTTRQCGMGAQDISPAAKHPDTIELSNLCIHPSGERPAVVTLDKDICVKRITLTHKSGRLSCRGPASGDSNWGCDANNLGVVLADGRDVVAPVFDTTVGMTPRYSAHSHWYSMDGVNKDSTQMAWTFHDSYKFAAGSQYRLWYNEDLSGHTESDNRGSACYDMTLEPAETCDDLAPLQFSNVCASAAGGAVNSINLPDDTCVSEIAIHHTSGHLNCHGDESGKSNFGCNSNMVGLVWTEKHSGQVLLPKEGQVKGVRRATHKEDWQVLYSKGSFGDTAMSKFDFNANFHAAAKSAGVSIVRRKCSSCDARLKEVYYKRKTNPETWDAYDGLLVTWRGDVNFHTDFDIYPTFDDAINEENAFQFCNGNDPGIGFPRDCGPTGFIGWQWTSLTRGGRHSHYQYSVYRVVEAPLDATWYTMGARGFGSGRDMRDKNTLHMTLNVPQQVSGALDLWYNEDLTGLTEGDNSGTACYEISVHRSASCNAPPAHDTDGPNAIPKERLTFSASGHAHCPHGSVPLSEAECEATFEDADVAYPAGTTTYAGWWSAPGPVVTGRCDEMPNCYVDANWGLKHTRFNRVNYATECPDGPGPDMGEYMVCKKVN